MATQQAIPNVQLNGARTFNFSNVPAGSDHARVTIDRTVPNGLNSMALGETLEISIDRSPDGGQTWVPAAGITCQGGTFITKGVTLAREMLEVGIEGDNVGFRINTVASSAVRIAGTVDYTP